MKVFIVKTLCVFFALLFSACGLYGCTATWQEIQSVRFNTDVYIAVKGQPIAQKDEILSYLKALETMLEVDGDSCVAKFNVSTANLPVAITEECAELFALSSRYYALTQGKFNIAVRPVSKLFKLTSDTYDGTPPEPFPTATQTDALKSAINLENINLDYSKKTLSKTVNSAQIDFGGIAKGYAVDKVTAILTQAGYSEGYINIGGSSLYIFSTQENLSIKHPRKNGEFIISVSNKLTRNTPLSTSGDYERFYMKNGKRISHIIDGISARPLETNIVSATVMGVSATLTDALSTALCCFTHYPNDINASPLIAFAKQLLLSEEYKNLCFFIIYDDGNIKQLLTNKKQGEDFTLLDKDYMVVEF